MSASAAVQDVGKSRTGHPPQSRIAAGGSSKTTKSFTGGPNAHGYAGASTCLIVIDSLRYLAH